MQVSRTICRAALFHLSVTSLARASNTSLILSTPRLHGILFPQCAIKLNDQIRTMSDSPKPSDSSPPSPQEQSSKPLYLPEAPDRPDTASNLVQGEGGIQLDMSGGGTEMKLDHLGPMVVNVDGTLSQIGNWAQMTESEQNNTLRIIGMRNQRRLKALKAAEAAEAAKAAKEEKE